MFFFPLLSCSSCKTSLRTNQQPAGSSKEQAEMKEKTVGDVSMFGGGSGCLFQTFKLCFSQRKLGEMLQFDVLFIYFLIGWLKHQLVWN